VDRRKIALLERGTGLCQDVGEKQILCFDLPTPAIRMRPLLLIVLVACSLAACDSGSTGPPLPDEGFGPSSFHLTLEDSTGVVVASGFTYETRLSPEPGDTVRADFEFWKPDSLGAGELLATCTEVVGEPAALYPDVFTYRLSAGGGATWVLTAACDQPGDGAWERLEGAAAVASGRFWAAIAVP